MLQVLSCIPSLGQDQVFCARGKMIVPTRHLGHSILNVRIFLHVSSLFRLHVSIRKTCLYR